MIDGVHVSPLKQFSDERGKVMHMMRSDAKNFSNFGEIYFSTVYSGMIKAWHLHHRMVINYAVPIGAIKFVLYDGRKESETFRMFQEIFLGPDNYSLVTVPPKVWNGFQGLGSETSLVANCASLPHDPNEIDRKNPFDPSIPYSWKLKY